MQQYLSEDPLQVELKKMLAIVTNTYQSWDDVMKMPSSRSDWIYKTIDDAYAEQKRESEVLNATAGGSKPIKTIG